MNGISDSTVLTALSAALHLVIQWLLIIRVLLKPHRDPRARLTWIVVIIALPIVGIITYLLLGETNIGNKRAKRMREVLAQTSTPETTLGVDSTNLAPQIPAHYQHLFQVGYSISGFEPVGGNHAKVLKDSNAVIDALVADIDAAQDHVHLLFYIWLTDNNGLKVAQALIRAATRGVACRAMADGAP